MAKVTTEVLSAISAFLQTLEGKRVSKKSSIILRTTHGESTETEQQMHTLVNIFCCEFEKTRAENNQKPFYFYGKVVTDARELTISISNHIGLGMSLWEISIEKYQSNKNDAKMVIQKLNLPDSFTVTDNYDAKLNQTSVCFSFEEEELPSSEWLGNLFTTLADFV